jgi:predicted enzyme related to lactoylglutathione lyase
LRHLRIYCISGFTDGSTLPSGPVCGYHFRREELQCSIPSPAVRAFALNVPSRFYAFARFDASLRFYVDALGFENASWGNDDFIHISRDGVGIYLCRGGQGQPGAWVWIGVDDVQTLHQEYTARSLTIRLPPTNFPWALEMQIEDPDGNVLRMGSEPK